MVGTVVAELDVHSQRNCYFFTPEQMEKLQKEVAVSTVLEPGVYTLKIKSGTFSYRGLSGHPGEPLVLLWIYGGPFTNRDTGVSVGATWVSLNGYEDAVTLEVKGQTTVSAFFFDTYLEDNSGELFLTVAKH